jgi:hypothetical protein
MKLLKLSLLNFSESQINELDYLLSENLFEDYDYEIDYN